MSEVVEEKMGVNDLPSDLTAARAVIDGEMSDRVGLPVGIYWHGSFEGNDQQMAVLAHEHVYHMIYGLPDDDGGPFSSFGVQNAMTRYLETGNIILDPPDVNLTRQKNDVFEND
jgi:hypothetical protein